MDSSNYLQIYLLRLTMLTILCKTAASTHFFCPFQTCWNQKNTPKNGFISKSGPKQYFYKWQDWRLFKFVYLNPALSKYTMMTCNAFPYSSTTILRASTNNAFCTPLLMREHTTNLHVSTNQIKAFKPKSYTTICPRDVSPSRHVVKVVSRRHLTMQWHNITSTMTSVQTKEVFSLISKYGQLLSISTEHLNS